METGTACSWIRRASVPLTSIGRACAVAGTNAATASPRAIRRRVWRLLRVISWLLCSGAVGHSKLGAGPRAVVRGRDGGSVKLATQTHGVGALLRGAAGHRPRRPQYRETADVRPWRGRLPSRRSGERPASDLERAVRGPNHHAAR